MKKISILGSTGSIGTQALSIVRSFSQEFRVEALSAYSDVESMFVQIQEFRPCLVCMYEEASAKKLRDLLLNAEDSFFHTVEVVSGMDGLEQVAALDSVDMVITSVVGMVGLLPTLSAIRKGKRIALANKETLVTAGHLVMEAARKHGAEIIPVDSEHSAIFQCLVGEREEDLARLIITASGGPFRRMTREQIQDKKAAQALKHPNWSMGAKITIDSATLMNKGLEVIEARWLFDIPQERIEVLVHPQSVIHSMVRFTDGSVKAQLGVPSMKLPILYAMSYPNRGRYEEEPIDFLQYSTLTFEKPDTEVFPCLRLAQDALRQGGSYLSVLNAANEELVYGYLKEQIAFYDIATMIEQALEKHQNIAAPSLEEVLDADRWARAFVAQRMKAVIR